MKLSKQLDINKGNNFREYFAWFGGVGPDSKRFITYKTTNKNQNPL